MGLGIQTWKEKRKKRKEKPTNQNKEEEEEEVVEEAVEEEPKNAQISSFPHRANGFELTIRANKDQAEEEEAIEDEDKEEAVAELDGDDCAGGFTGFVEGSGRIYGLKGKNKVKCPLSLNMLHR